MTVHLPGGYRLKNVQFDGEKAEIEQQGTTTTVRIVPSATAILQWEMKP